jgi:hypothetical protein
MARKKQAAPSRGAPSRGAGAGPSRAADDADDVAYEVMQEEEEEEEEEAPPRKRVRRGARRADGDGDAATPLLLPLLPSAGAGAGALCVGRIPLTWQTHASGSADGSGASAAATDTTHAAPHSLLLHCAADSDDEDAADDGAHAGSTRCVALCDGAGDAGGACTLAAPRRVTRALATLVCAGAAAAALSSCAASLRVCLTAAAFSDAPSDAMAACATPAHAATRTLLSWLLRRRTNDNDGGGGNDDASPSASGFEPAALYARLRRCHVSISGGGEGAEVNAPQLPLQVPGLRPRLRPYQARAAAWLLARERDAPEAGRHAHNGGLHPLWTRMEAEDADADADVDADADADADAASRPCFYFCALSGRLSRAPFLFPPLPRGGILADEMVRERKSFRERCCCVTRMHALSTSPSLPLRPVRRRAWARRWSCLRSSSPTSGTRLLRRHHPHPHPHPRRSGCGRRGRVSASRARAAPPLLTMRARGSPATTATGGATRPACASARARADAAHLRRMPKTILSRAGAAPRGALARATPRPAAPRSS